MGWYPPQLCLLGYIHHKLVQYFTSINPNVIRPICTNLANELGHHLVWKMGHRNSFSILLVIYPLLNIQKNMENHHLYWVIKSTISMAMFNSFVIKGSWEAIFRVTDN